MTNAHGFKFTNPLVDEDDDEGPVSTAPTAASPSQTVVRVPAERSEAPTPEPLPSQTVKEEQWTNPFVADESEEEEPPTTEAHPHRPAVVAAVSTAPFPAVGPSHIATSTHSRRKVYNRKLLNKHDYELLGFLAVMKVANTRILGLALGKTDRQVQQRLKGLQEMGLTDNRLLPGTQAIWAVTPKGVRVLRKKDLLENRSFVKGTRLELLKISSLGHKVAEATVAAHFMNGHHADLLGPVTWRNLIHENEISAGFSTARNELNYRPDVRSSDVRRKLHTLRADELWAGSNEARLYLARRGIADDPDPTKLPDLVVDGALRMAVEVELYAKDYRDYLPILETYRQDELTYGRVLYVARTKGIALLIMRAAAEVHGVARRDRINSPDMWENAPRDGSATDEMLAEQRRIAEDFAKLDGRLMVEPLYDASGSVFNGDPWFL